VDQTLVASLPETGDSQDDSQSVEEALKGPDLALKAFCRGRGGGSSVVCSERVLLWKGVYEKREGKENVAANAGLYWDTVNTIYGGNGDVLV